MSSRFGQFPAMALYEQGWKQHSISMLVLTTTKYNTDKIGDGKHSGDNILFPC
jgi:hypothetical protein